MRAGHAAHVDTQVAAELARETRPAANSPAAGFALGTSAAGGAGAAIGGAIPGNAPGAGSISMRDNGTAASALGRAGSGASLPSDQATASSEGSLLSQLHQLSQSDPAQFQKTANGIADRLQFTAASSSEQNAKAIAPLISSFREAATTGALPALGNLGAASTQPSPNLNAKVLKYAQGNSAAAGEFALGALNDAVQGALTSGSR